MYGYFHNSKAIMDVDLRKIWIQNRAMLFFWSSALNNFPLGNVLTKSEPSKI